MMDETNISDIHAFDLLDDIKDEHIKLDIKADIERCKQQNISKLVQIRHDIVYIIKNNELIDYILPEKCSSRDSEYMICVESLTDKYDLFSYRSFPKARTVVQQLYQKYFNNSDIMLSVEKIRSGKKRWQHLVHITRTKTSG
jgi:hypothetical protein